MTGETMTIEAGPEAAVEAVTQVLSRAGFRVTRSFDLSSACAPRGKPCPHHGNRPCTCEVAVLTVRGFGRGSHALAIHSCEGVSQIDLVGSSGPAEETSTALLRLALQAGLG